MEVEQVQVFPKLLTAQDVAVILSVPLSTLHHWAVQGAGPPSFKVGRHRRYDDELDIVATALDRLSQDATRRAGEASAPWNAGACAQIVRN